MCATEHRTHQPMSPRGSGHSPCSWSLQPDWDIVALQLSTVLSLLPRGPGHPPLLSQPACRGMQDGAAWPCTSCWCQRSDSHHPAGCSTFYVSGPVTVARSFTRSCSTLAWDKQGTLTPSAAERMEKEHFPGCGRPSFVAPRSLLAVFGESFAPALSEEVSHRSRSRTRQRECAERCPCGSSPSFPGTRRCVLVVQAAIQHREEN